ncbi:hypothetical protein N9M66_02655 [Litoreibacter sp.]|nr:hypothetical protein [Litoreibacter sp.]
MPNYVSPNEGNHTLRTARRILVIGSSAGGKSTLSRKIAAQFDLPYVSLDHDVRWLPGWTVRDRTEQRRLTEQFVMTEAWVMDGTTVSSFDLRGPRADLVIWMRPHRLRAMWQLTKRVWGSYGKVRVDMAEGCPEQLPDREFLNWIWTFEKKQSPRIIEALDRFAADVPVVTLRKPSDYNQMVFVPK